jgi:choline dehydrogenase-like flavoprotein
VTKIYDYIIIGSGPGGSVLAYNLSKVGARCLLIEAGKYYRKDTYPRSEVDASAQLYWGGGLELSHGANMGFLRAKTVGGGSVVNQALMDRFDDIAFDDWRDESGVDFFSLQAMMPHYENVEKSIALHTFQPHERNRNAELFTQACDTLGYEWECLRRGQDDCGIEQGNDCIGCLRGCHRDSKQSTAITFIRRAEQEGLAVHAQTMVARIESTSETVCVYASSNGTQPVQYEGRNLILSAGTFGTSQILLRSGFKRDIPALGKFFASHPQFMFFALHDEEINAHKGMFQTVTSKDSRFRSRGFKLENVFGTPSSIALLLAGFGARHQDLMRKYRHLTCAEVAVRDENAGEITTNRKGGLVIKKPLTDQDRRRMKDGASVLKEILATSGAKQVLDSPWYFGLHLMGGCCMGTDPERSVVEPDFRLRGHSNIYVCDASLFPNAPGINPSLTIMALAQRLSYQLAGS